MTYQKLKKKPRQKQNQNPNVLVKRKIVQEVDFRWLLVPKNKKLPETQFYPWFLEKFGAVKLSTKYRITVEAI